LKQIQLFDTTLRDGTQGEKVTFSVEDKLRIARRLDVSGMHYIEGGWPGSNPKDAVFFEQARRESWRHARLVAFGSTRRAESAPEEDPNLNMLLKAETPAVAIFGKSWALHATVALGVSREENCRMISESVAFMKKHGREVIYDAEHFFDGYKHDPEYNGGALPSEVYEITARICGQIPAPVGIHTHNDGELAVSNALEAVRAGAVHVQGTINGFGERCGNANLVSVIANLQLKLGYHCVSEEQLAALTELSAFVYDLANLAPRDEAAFVGKSAFAHKGGIHVSAVMKEPVTYEHIQPELVGNTRRVLVSDLSGRSNVYYKMKELGINGRDEVNAGVIVQEIKELEHQGYSFEAAEASFELLVERHHRRLPVFFHLSGFRVAVEKDSSDSTRSEASIRVNVDGHLEHTAAEGDGPVNALDNALRKALLRFYPEIALMRLVDYKVRVLNDGSGTAARVRVLIESQSQEARWSTIGVSENIIAASWEALVDSFTYFLYKRHTFQPVQEQAA
jgi:2-isopropylmalate synthase